MQVVVNILEQDYERVVHNNRIPVARMRNAIRNGTILPKGHGRLIDEKDLSLMTVHMIDGVLVCDAPTIIEAEGRK